MDILNKQFDLIRNIGHIVECLDAFEILKKPELLTEYISTSGSLQKHQICLLREYINDDNLFNKKIGYLDNSDESLPSIKIEKKCTNCNSNLCTNISPLSNYFSFIFVIQIQNRNYYLKDYDIKNLTINFLNFFKDGDNLIAENPEIIENLLIDYDISNAINSINKSEATNLEIIQELNELYSFITDSEIRINNFTQNKPKNLKSLKKLIKSKLKFYEKKYSIEKDLQINKERKQEIKSNSNSIINEQKSIKILNRLNEYGFSELESLKNIKIKEITYHIFNNSKPYQIAYLQFLGFIKKLEDDYCNSSVELHKLLSDLIFYTERAVRGNINGIKNEKSTDRNRYTAYKHIEKVKKHYQTLK